MEKNSKIFVAGHNGMVGSAIVTELKKQGFYNLILKSSKELDLRRQSETEEFFMTEKPEYVFLAAAKVGGIMANDTYKADFIYDNIAIAANVINAAYKSGVSKLLNLGSSCIYPKYADQPMKEDMLLTGELEPTNEPYAIAKIAAIKLCRYFNEQYGTDFISLMPTNLYGINDNYNLETSHVLPALIRKTLLAKALMLKDYDFIINDAKEHKLGFGIEINDNDTVNNITEKLSKFGIYPDKLVLWGSGNVYREFLLSNCVADAAIYFMLNISSKEMGEFVNIGSGEDLTIKELAYLIKTKTGYSGKIEFDKTKPDGTPKKLLDIYKARSLGWQSKCDLNFGLDKVIYYYLNKVEKQNEDIISIQ